MFVIYITLAVILGLFGVHTLRAYLVSFKYRSLPPGPPRRPIIGNLFDFPKPGCKEWEHWLKHKDLYGGFLQGYLPLEFLTLSCQAPSVHLLQLDRQLSSSTNRK